jgi:lipoprotein NlpI
MKKSLILILSLVPLWSVVFAQELPISPEEEAAMIRKGKLMIEKLDKAIEQDPTSINLLKRRGVVQLEIGHFEAARKDFEAIIELDPTREAPLWERGIVEYFLGRWDEASDQFAKYYEVDPRDREDGLWKFLADVHRVGIDRARAEMLEYKEFDRQPFPGLYAVYAGQITPEDFTAEVHARSLNRSPLVDFNTHYYLGLYEDLFDHREAALEHLGAAVALFNADTALDGGPGLMWQIARLQFNALRETAELPLGERPAPKPRHASGK